MYNSFLEWVCMCFDVWKKAQQCWIPLYLILSHFHSFMKPFEKILKKKSAFSLLSSFGPFFRNNSLMWIWIFHILGLEAGHDNLCNGKYFFAFLVVHYSFYKSEYISTEARSFFICWSIFSQILTAKYTYPLRNDSLANLEFFVVFRKFSHQNSRQNWASMKSS